MQEVIFVSGLHRSGTTILAMVLGAHSRLIAVGEVDNVIAAEQDRDWVESHYDKCSCGKCHFWPQVLKEIDEAGAESYAERYAIFLSVFSSVYPDKIPVDSSKHLHRYHAMSEVCDPKVVKITRDYRGWSFSMKGRVSARSALRWYRSNKNFDRTLSIASSVSYEKLVFNPKTEISGMCESIGLSYEESMIQANASDSHILIGNRMRLSGVKGLSYDSRWMRQNNLLAQLMFPVIRYNQAAVHCNT